MRRWILVLAVFALAACEPTADSEILPTIMQLPSAEPVISDISTQPDPIQILPYYEAVSGTLAAGEADLWQFEANHDDQLTLRAISASVVTQITLMDSSGAIIAEGVDIETVIQSSGVHTLRVAAAQGEGEYQLGLSYTNRPIPAEPTFTSIPQIVGVPTPEPLYSGLGDFVNELRTGETVPGNFQIAASAQVFTFTANAGQYAHISLDPVSGDGDLIMTLYNPDAIAMAADGASDNGAGILRDIPLSFSGIYSVRVESNGQPATYTLKLNLSENVAQITPTYYITPTATMATPVLTPVYDTAKPGERLSPKKPVTAEISPDSFLNTHSFSIKAGDTVTIAVSPHADSSLIPHVEIIDPDGEPMMTVIGNLSPFDRDAIISPLVAKLDGPYTLFVTGEGETQGAYTVAFGYGTTHENIFRGEALPDRANLAEISRRATADMWHVALSQGDLISVGITPMDGNIVPVLELYTGSGQLLGIDSQSGGERSPLVSGVRAPQTGIYLLKVRPAAAGTIGAYQLVWRYLDLGPTPTPPAGTLPILTVKSALESEEYAFYPFQGRAGQRILVSVRAEESSLDPVAAIIGTDGAVIAEGDDSTGTLDAYFEATLPHDGTYQLRINGYLSSGGFRATITGVYQ